MERVRRILAWAIGSGSAILTIIIRGGIVATVVYLGCWAYPVYLVADCATALFVAWLYGNSQPLKESWLSRKLGISEEKLRSGSIFIRILAYLALLLVAALCGPPFAATILRGMGFNGKKAYCLVLGVTIPASIFWTTVYLGFIEAFRYSFL